ncbi:hypothetical protein LCGC14_0622410 [marine sediment metagenome]|uniref:Uncharacterized protein n=1 Tax=marine sediment metagenome TaxID=412755 RepID=A0A0F9R4C6_9ZZZZ
MGFPGFNRAKRGSISNGDWDRDGVKNRKDCEPLNFRKQGPEHERQEKFKKRLELLKLKKGVMKSNRYDNEIEVLEDLIH